jgi:RNA polymerase sigma-70 factor (ECF subfamily)
MTSALSMRTLVSALDADDRPRADVAMERYADGDDKAFSVLYDELAPRLFRFAMRETRNRSAAEDVVQQTLLQIHGARARFVRGAAVVPWAFAIARRLIIDGRRHAVHVARMEDAEGARAGEADTSTPSPEEALDRRRREAELELDLRALPGHHREAFKLVKLEGLSVAVAADVLGTTPANVKIRTHRATEALRRADARRRRETP